MLFEYAVEPQAIGSSWEMLRYVIEKFGFDKGRLISQFPKHWFREVYQATEGLPDVQRKRVEEALNLAKKNKVVRCGRLYDPELGNWFDNALAEHRRDPFHAIIAGQNPNGHDAVLCTDDLDEQYALMIAPHDCAVKRDVDSLAAVLSGMLRFGSRIVFIDPFFDPYSPRHKRIFFRCLSIVKERNPQASCEVHYRFHKDKPDNSRLEREAENLFHDIIPEGMTLTIYCWAQKEGGEDFHARYLLTDKGGIRVDAGFEPVGEHQMTDVSLMGLELAEMRMQAFGRDAEVYELVEPVLRIDANGHVEHV